MRKAGPYAWHDTRVQLLEGADIREMAEGADEENLLGRGGVACRNEALDIDAVGDTERAAAVAASRTVSRKNCLAAVALAHGPDTVELVQMAFFEGEPALVLAAVFASGRSFGDLAVQTVGEIVLHQDSG